MYLKIAFMSPASFPSCMSNYPVNREGRLYRIATATARAATRPPCTFKPAAPLSLELGAEVDSVAAADSVELASDPVDEDSVVDADSDALEDSDDALDVMVESVVAVESVAVEPVAVESVAVDVTLPVDEATDALSVFVLCAPTIPKLGEKLILDGSVSSMISMVYWKELTWSGSTVNVKVPSEAGIPARQKVSACTPD